MVEEDQRKYCLQGAISLECLWSVWNAMARPIPLGPVWFQTLYISRPCEEHPGRSVWKIWSSQPNRGDRMGWELSHIGAALV